MNPAFGTAKSYRILRPLPFLRDALKPFHCQGGGGLVALDGDHLELNFLPRGRAFEATDHTFVQRRRSRAPQRILTVVPAALLSKSFAA